MKIKLLTILSAALLLSSCATVKDIAYFQNKSIDHPEKIDKHAGIIIQPKDQLSIVVSSKNPELVAMFNLPVVSYQAGSEFETGTSQQRLMGYVVDNNGQIEFPVLGTLDLTIYGERENVTVIRERDGERVFYEINLCDVNLFKSPAYYLQQNDIIYVQPNKNKARQSTMDDKGLRMTSIFV